MDYIKPSEVAEAFFANAVAKSKLAIRQLLLRGFASRVVIAADTPKAAPEPFPHPRSSAVETR